MNPPRPAPPEGTSSRPPQAYRGQNGRARPEDEARQSLRLTEEGRPGLKQGRPDYRLRGLDLGQPGVDEAPARPARRNRLGRRSRRRLVMKWLFATAVAVGAGTALRLAVVEPFSVTSSAMAPTLQTGDRVLVLKSGIAGRISSGDLVAFRLPEATSCSVGENPQEEVVKRVIALPGQTIWSRGSKIYVNGHVLREPGWFDHRFGQIGRTPLHRTTVPPGDYYVLGDNRLNSCDSRSFGPVPRSAVLGKVVAVFLRDSHPYFHFF